MNRKEMYKMLSELKDILAQALMMGSIKRDDKYAGVVLSSLIHEALEKGYIEHASWMDFAISGPSEASIAAAMLSAMLREDEDDAPEDNEEDD